MFTNLDTVWTQYYWDFYGGIYRVDPTNRSLQHSPLPQRWEVGWKFQASNHGLVFLVTCPHPEDIQEPTKSCLIGTEDALITQEIPKVWGPLCQERRQRPTYFLLLFHGPIHLTPSQPIDQEEMLQVEIPVTEQREMWGRIMLNSCHYSWNHQGILQFLLVSFTFPVKGMKNSPTHSGN